MVRPLEEIFPGLAKGNYKVTSPADPKYNCVAWAASATTDWWWPGPNIEREYWPANLPRDPTLTGFVAIFASMGYEPCAGESLEPGAERIAIFADTEGYP